MYCGMGQTTHCVVYDRERQRERETERDSRETERDSRETAERQGMATWYVGDIPTRQFYPTVYIHS